jgi:hypothetical protein
VAVFALAVGQTRPVRAATLYVYDQDSLVHLSTDVVEAEIVRSYEKQSVSLVDVKVLLPHKGGFKTGQTVVVADIDCFQKVGAGERFARDRLAVGDRLVLFLVRARADGFFRLPDDTAIYAPVPGGVTLLHGGRAFGFAQWDNPGPYVADVAQADAPTVERFQESLRGSLRAAEDLARLVESPPDDPRLLKLLADRSVQSIDRRDYFTARVCVRFAETHDPALLSRALPLAKGYYERSILRRGFGTPKGRDYLLARVEDTGAPMADRLMYAAALGDAGHVYRSTHTDIGPSSTRVEGAADAGNSGYLTRIAKAAGAAGTHEKLCLGLVRCLDTSVDPSRTPELAADQRSAFAALAAFHATRPSEEIQFAIECVAAHHRESYEKLKTASGTFVSILRPADPAKYTKPERRSLIVEYAYSTALLDRDAEVRPAVVLVHQGTRQRFTLPTDLRIRGWSTGGGSTAVELPDLPAGRYHVFFELRDGAEVTSTGHYFAADL